MTLHLLGFSGSLRQASYNAALLRAAGELLPDDMTLEYFDLAPIPLYNDDVHQQGFPASVQRFRERIDAADALLIATPEYNFSISGVLKNAIDWASRPDHNRHVPLNWKVAALMGASTGGFGTVRAQMQLRQMFVMTNTYTLNRPQVLVTFAAQKFDQDLHLIDEPTRGFIRDLLLALGDFAPRFADLSVGALKVKV